MGVGWGGGGGGGVLTLIGGGCGFLSYLHGPIVWGGGGVRRGRGWGGEGGVAYLNSKAGSFLLSQLLRLAYCLLQPFVAPSGAVGGVVFRQCVLPPAFL